MTWFLITQYVQVEVECDVVPDYSEMYQYRQDEWVKLSNFDFYSSVPGRFIGKVLVVTMSIILWGLLRYCSVTIGGVFEICSILVNWRFNKEYKKVLGARK